MVRIGRYELGGRWLTRRRLIFGAILLFALLAYMHYKEQLMIMGRATVTVAPVVKKSVPIYIDYVGTTAAKMTVDIRARVEGFLVERNFVEGDDVKEGDLLYVIDPRPYEAALAEAKGQLARDEAELAFAKEQVERYRGLSEKDYVSRENFDNLVTSMQEAAARVESSAGAAEQASLNLGYCRVYAPFDGRLGRTLVNVGNLVGKGEATKLATIVLLDPIYVYFSPSDEESHRIVEHMARSELSVGISFADGEQCPHMGTLEFVDNQVDAGTSTVAMRATVPNPEKTLLPGVYVNARLFLSESEEALLIPEKALAADQIGQYVMALEAGSVAKRVYVSSGAKYDGMRAVTGALSPGEEVIIEGLQLVKPGDTVTAKSAAAGETMQAIVHRAILGR
ncbi:MAG: efflux RND transporter periplasmic adaptor subunit [Proteobacteria bacterium]|nr:efflux RND transporter periplasmic adaptor subunit [Pseudomonadota bacterium]